MGSLQTTFNHFNLVLMWLFKTKKMTVMKLISGGSLASLGLRFKHVILLGGYLLALCSSVSKTWLLFLSPVGCGNVVQDGATVCYHLPLHK